MSVQDLIDAARAEADNPETDAATVVVAGRKVELTFKKLLGADWSALTAVNPPRPGAQTDSNLGYNLDAVGAVYPEVTVDGEPVTVAEWGELYALLDAPWRETVALKLWGLNQFGPARKLLELGKVSSGAGSKKKRN